MRLVLLVFTATTVFASCQKSNEQANEKLYLQDMPVVDLQTFDTAKTDSLTKHSNQVIGIEYQSDDPATPF